MSARSAASVSGSRIQPSSSPGSIPASVAARAIVAGSSSASPAKVSTRRRRSSGPQRSSERSRAATTARHACTVACERAAAGVHAIGIP